MFRGPYGFERLMGCFGTLMFIGVLATLVWVFDGGPTGEPWEPPEEDAEHVLIDLISSTDNLDAIRDLVQSEPWRVTEERLEGWHPIHAAVTGIGLRRQSIELLELLLDTGADVNAQIDADWPRERQTPLLVAIPHSNPELVRMLLERGADVHARTRGGQGPRELTNGIWNERIRAEVKELIEAHL